MSLDFQPVDLAMKPLVDRYIAPHGIWGSEYTFTNLLMWGQNGQIKIAEKDSAMFFLLNDADGSAFMFAPLTEGDYASAVRTGAEYLEARGFRSCFHGISGPLEAKFRESCPEYKLEYDRNDSDYLYLASDLIELRGKKFHAKRNHVNRFLLDNTFEYVDLDSSMLDECLGVYDEWLGEKLYADASALSERTAIEAVVSNMEALGVKGGGIRLGGRLAAFSLGERINNELAVIHIEKADDVDGLFSFINQQFAQHCWQNVEYINREEDMGIEGLRKAKLSYRPVRLIDKYIAVK